MEEKAKKTEFINPLETGVSYAVFLEAVDKSKKSIADYCKGHLEEDTINWIENEINQIKK